MGSSNMAKVEYSSILAVLSGPKRVIVQRFACWLREYRTEECQDTSRVSYGGELEVGSLSKQSLHAA